MSRFHYKPKTIVDAKIAVLIGESCGYRRLFDTGMTMDSWALAHKQCAITHGLLFTTNAEEEHLILRGAYNDDGVSVLTLDALLAAISPKPKPTKEPKFLGTVKICEGKVNYSDREATLLPDGSIKVGCTTISKDDMERVCAEWAAYNKEEGK